MEAPATPDRGPSYSQILKSTALIGGSSVINVLFSIIRNKAMALLLGPAGVGLIGLYSSIADIACALAGLGIQASGVRQIAEAVGSGDADRVARTAIVLRRTSLVLGLLGAVLLAALAYPIADFTFGGPGYAGGVALLSAAIFLRLLSDGQTALIQGMRDIASLARINILAAFFSTAISIPLIYLFGTSGIVPLLVAAAAATLATSWWHRRQIRLHTPPMSARQVREETAALLKLGVVFMASGFLTLGAAYAIRLIVMRAEGIAGAGLYQAAWTLGGFYASFVLQAMGTDFYPRLTAVAQDDAECNRLVNEQAQISMLLAGPGLIATLTAAPLIMRLLYSPEFYAAVDLLRWICLGMMLRVIAWPMGFIVLAKGAKKAFFWTEVAATLVHVGLAWLLVRSFGPVGAGAAFFGLYVWHGLLIYTIVRHLSGFRWSSANRKLALIFLPASGLVFGALFVLPPWPATVFGLVTAMLSGAHSLRMLAELVPLASLPAALRAWRSRSA
ncbi:O-antigen translocase [Sinorhizobium mexicanum]|uniref:O-antigen translocase n=1 Tax=Sinorhizobium mexicanum TaxID=375549 RepID=A0A859QL60_9HYPH|nr:O-antigen translocase [Sinorhizobium mexicanum]MBP1887311.1 PST family polysaccharide transporter [Sinorhizobium mexicanum]QLL65804.1 O-antigen translocase [Sinorhizobium mexicanum]